MMKKLTALLIALMLLGCCAPAWAETIDLDQMTLEELTDLKLRVQEAIISAYAKEGTGAYAATREQPAPVGASVRYNGSFYMNTAVTELTVLEVLRGDAAWRKVHAWNDYNEVPGDEEEYILVRVRAEAIAAKDGEQAEIYDYDFSFVSAEGAEYEYAYVAGVDLELASVYEGANTEGWVIGRVGKGDQPLMVYLKDADHPVWFDLNQSILTPEDRADPAEVLMTLMRGDINEDVRAMQQALIDMGYLTGTADGNFGRMTEAAVSAYQEAMGLRPTGIADDATLRLILSYTKPE